MRLMILTNYNEDRIYINPDHVSSIRSEGNGSRIIMTGDRGSDDVKEDIKTVAIEFSRSKVESVK